MIRKPAVAGRFYQEDSTRLKQQIHSCFTHHLGCGEDLVSYDDCLKAVIAPHAGYMFSGPVASHGFARIAGEKTSFDTIIMLGPKHTRFGAGFAVSGCDQWNTPLGNVGIDQEITSLLTDSSSIFQISDEAHTFEHSLEVLLPFLQYSLTRLPQIVPVAIGFSDFSDLSRAGFELRNLMDGIKHKKILILVSSDFSHDTPKEIAYSLDSEVIDLILNFKAEEFYNKILDEDRSVCGVMPITVMLETVKMTNISARLLKYATSMDISEHDRGVGYASIIFEATR